MNGAIERRFGGCLLIYRACAERLTRFPAFPEAIVGRMLRMIAGDGVGRRRSCSDEGGGAEAFAPLFGGGRLQGFEFRWEARFARMLRVCPSIERRGAKAPAMADSSFCRNIRSVRWCLHAVFSIIFKKCNCGNLKNMLKKFCEKYFVGKKNNIYLYYRFGKIEF